MSTMPIMPVKRKGTHGFTITFRTLVDEGPPATYDPVDITGKDVLFTVKNDPNDTDAQALISKKILAADHTTPASGITRLELTSEDTDIAAGKYFYDFVAVTPGSDPVDRVPTNTGRFYVDQYITQRDT